MASKGSWRIFKVSARRNTVEPTPLSGPAERQKFREHGNEVLEIDFSPGEDLPFRLLRGYDPQGDEVRVILGRRRSDLAPHLKRRRALVETR
jgi:hypothetical protein